MLADETVCQGIVGTGLAESITLELNAGLVQVDLSVSATLYASLYVDLGSDGLTFFAVLL